MPHSGTTMKDCEAGAAGPVGKRLADPVWLWLCTVPAACARMADSQHGYCIVCIDLFGWMCSSRQLLAWSRVVHAAGSAFADCHYLGKSMCRSVNVMDTDGRGLAAVRGL